MRNFWFSKSTSELLSALDLANLLISVQLMEEIFYVVSTHLVIFTVSLQCVFRILYCHLGLWYLRYFRLFTAYPHLWFSQPGGYFVSLPAPWAFTKWPQRLEIILLRAADYTSDKLLERYASGMNNMRFASLRWSVLPDHTAFSSKQGQSLEQVCASVCEALSDVGYYLVSEIQPNLRTQSFAPKPCKHLTRGRGCSGRLWWHYKFPKAWAPSLGGFSGEGDVQGS